MATLQQITTRAKQLKKKHPNTKWTNLIKQASKELKGVKSAPKKKKATVTAKRKTTVKKVAKKRTVKRSVSGVTSSLASKTMSREYTELRNAEMSLITLLEKKKAKDFKHLPADKKRTINQNIVIQRQVIKTAKQNIAKLKTLR